MKRFASHYLYLPHIGFLKKYVVEVNEHGYVVCFFPLQEEIESVVWLPGVITLISQHSFNLHESACPVRGEALFTLASFDSQAILQTLPLEYAGELTSQKLYAFRLYPFDYVQMKPKLDTVLYQLSCDYVL